MLVYLTAATTFGGNPKAPGFYYWDNGTIDWIGISSAANGDHDWYEQGTTTAPNAITDNMFHTGNVAIGKNTANSALDVLTSGTPVSSINNTFNSTSSSGVSRFGFANAIQGNSNDGMYAISNTITNTGTGSHFGTFNSLSGAGTGIKYGVRNELSGSGQINLQLQHPLAQRVGTSKRII
ncbi:MAG: hypothetical protein IPN80_09070 [Flavobacterium sp.]|nr:hypothetical protein [Flavobacterium sp.]